MVSVSSALLGHPVHNQSANESGRYKSPFQNKRFWVRRQPVNQARRKQSYEAAYEGFRHKEQI